MSSFGPSPKRRRVEEDDALNQYNFSQMSQELFTSQDFVECDSHDEEQAQSQFFGEVQQSQSFKLRTQFTQSQILCSFNFQNDILTKDSEDESDNESLVNFLPITSSSQNHSQEIQSSEHSSITALNDNYIDNGLPEAIINFYNNVKEHFSDWTFISLIAGQLCIKQFPMGAYSNLKMALLMSLVSPSTAPLHIIAIGRETSHANIVMRSLGKFSQRFLSVSQNYDGITVKKNDVIEGGPMSLAANGVAYIGNWHRLPTKVVLKYLREIELGIIMVDKIQKNFPLMSALWSYWSFSTSVKKDTASIDQFLNVFGVPIVFDESNEEFIINDLLEQVSIDPPERANNFKISEQDFQAYIECARELKVNFDSHAEIMLRNYFIATKTIRRDTLTEKAYDVLKKMAESHAKLCLRTTVMRQDILAAINICEKFIKLLFDTDSYSSPNESRVTSIEHYDAYMNQLYDWYSCFTKDILEKI